MATACSKLKKLHAQQKQLFVSADAIVGLLDEKCKQAVCPSIMLRRNHFVFISIAVGSIYSTVWSGKYLPVTLLEWSLIAW